MCRTASASQYGQGCESLKTSDEGRVSMRHGRVTFDGFAHRGANRFFCLIIEPGHSRGWRQLRWDRGAGRLLEHRHFSGQRLGIYVLAAGGHVGRRIDSHGCDGEASPLHPCSTSKPRSFPALHSLRPSAKLMQKENQFRETNTRQYLFLFFSTSCSSIHHMGGDT